MRANLSRLRLVVLCVFLLVAVVFTAIGFGPEQRAELAAYVSSAANVLPWAAPTPPVDEKTSGRTAPESASPAISLTGLGSAYSQSFNTLVSSGTGTEAANTPQGWTFLETGTNANTDYTAGTGSGTGGDTYSFGSVGNSDRAFGGLFSGTLNPSIGAQFVNNTGQTITSLGIAYTGEEWRLGTAGRTDTLSFEYSLNATTINTGAWIQVPALSFTTPNTTTTGEKDGNASANRTNISSSISGLSIPNGATFWIRWLDIDASGADDGLAIDTFNLTPYGAAGAGVVSASKTDVLFNDIDGDGRVDPGDTIEYTATITNNTANPLTGTAFTDTIDGNTTLVPGSVTASPIAAPDSYTATGNVQISQPAVGGLLANDLSPITGDNTGLTATAQTISSSNCTGGCSNNVVIAADGSFTYNPPPGFEGADTFTYGLNAPGGGTATGTVTVTVSGMIWFVNSAAATNGDGRLTSPFDCYTGAGCFSTAAADDPGDAIFLYQSGTAYTGGNALLNNQLLIGQDATDSIVSITGITLAPNSMALPATDGAAGGVNITTSIAAVNAVNLGSGNSLRGFTIGNVGSGAAGVVGMNFGTLTVGGAAPDVVISTNGQAIGLNNGSLANTQGFISVSSSAGVSNIVLTSVGGTVRLGNGALSGATGTAFDINGGMCLVTYNGTLGYSGAGAALNVLNHSAGVVSFGGAWTVTNGTGLQFSNADSSYLFGTTVSLNGGNAGIDILSGSSGQVSITNTA
ncbi:MAG: beta strand repeat-containing protein, partial [Pyrinomonadaceae bacterium]